MILAVVVCSVKPVSTQPILALVLGPLNSWDRQPFLTTVRDGTPSMIMAWRRIHHNFFIDNYSPQVMLRPLRALWANVALPRLAAE